MNHRLIKLSAVLFFLFTQLFSQDILINEFHAKPQTSSGQIEFIELLHVGVAPIDIGNWKIADASSEKSLPSVIVNPGEFIVLAEDASLASSVPVGTHYIVPSGGLPSLNNSGDTIILSNSLGVAIDLLVYDSNWAVDYDFTTEKIRPELESNSVSNWKLSKISYGTPGEPNSVLPLAIDGEIITANTNVNPSVIEISETTVVSVDIKNIGLTTFSGKVIIEQNGIEVGSQVFSSLSVLNTTTVQVITNVLSSGNVTLDIILEVGGDLDTSNNNDSATVGVRYENRVLSVNEFLAQPFGNQIEFVELIHQGTTPINLNNWRIADNRDGTNYSLPATIVQPGDFIIIAPDSSIYPQVPIGTHYIIPSGGFPSLNNSGDDVRIFDPYDTKIDSLTYGPIWYLVEGLSKEKLLPHLTSEPYYNWKNSSVDVKMTPGSENSVIPFNIDGTINEEINFTPTFPYSGQNLTAIVTVMNVGIQSINGTILATYNGVIVGSANSPNLNMGQTAKVEVPISGFQSGRHLVSFTFSVANDENLLNNSTTKQLDVSFEFGDVKLNEFHAKPNENQIEFIELVSSQSFIMAGWKIADNSTRAILPPNHIKSGDYIVVAEDTSLKSISSPEAPYIIPYDGLPSLNNSGDTIYLLDNTNTVIDSLVYGSGWPVAADTSTEKLRPDLISNDLLNWKICTNNIGMTPGYENSNYIVDFDGEIIADNIISIPQFPKNNEQIQLNIPVTNHGAEPLSGTLRVSDENDSVIESVNFSDIARRDTTDFTFNLQPLPSGIHPIKIVLDVNKDPYWNNNIVNDTIYVSYDFGDVLINEFLAGPSSTQAEFVELISFTDIDFINWSIEDATNNPKYFDGGEISNDKYIVLSEDLAFSTIIPAEASFVEVEDFPSLNNYGDAIILKDFTGTIIDSLTYTTWWDLKTGTSTEKIHPEFVSADSTGWKISTDSTGMTPGGANSVTAKNIDGVILTDMVFNNPEHPESYENFKLTIPIANHGLQSISGSMSVEYGGVILANTTVSNIAMGDTMFYHLDVQPLPSGVHKIDIQLDITNDEKLENNSAQYDILVSYDFGDVLINEFLADPESPLSEFVELYTFEDIDFIGWGIADNRKNPVYFGNETIEQDNYVILSEDANLATMIPVKSTLFEVNNFPSLNNSGDGIFIYDFTGKIIDSLNYNNADWPMDGGISSEKLFPNYISNDAAKWEESIDPSGTTIGRINSVILQNINGTILDNLTTHYPEYPHPSESIAFTIAIQNTGIDEIDGEVSVLQNDVELGSATFENLISADSAFVSFNIEPLQSGNNELKIVLDVASDMNPADNQVDYNIYVSYPFGTVVLNEFLAKPDTTQAEFVEIIALSDIDLTGWSIRDNTFKQYHFDEHLASANQPIVVTGDSLFAAFLDISTPFIIPLGGWPTLNNEIDGIYLYDATGAIIYSLSYNAEWPIAEARSTEKYRPDFESYDMNRWGIAVNEQAMTPGQENSLYFDELPDKGTIEFEKNPFSPDGDGFDDELLIRYKLPFEQGIIKLQIFDMTGREIAAPYWNVYFPQEGILQWDGRRENGDVARIGIYIIKLSAKDPTGNDTWEKVKTVVLAKKL